MSDPSNRRSTRRKPNLVPEYDNWIKVGQYYFINLPVVSPDPNNEGKFICDYGALEMRYKNDTEGYSMYAKGVWPPKNAFFPYGGGRDLISEEQYINLLKHNTPKNGGDSRTHYLVSYKTGPGVEDWMYLDGHPRHARDLNYPENCCWPGSRLQTCNRGEVNKVNMVLERVDPDYKGKFMIPKDSYPDYPYIHWPVFAYSDKQIKDGDELLVWYGWSKNALTRFIGPEIKTNTGHRKTTKRNSIPESKKSVSDI